MGKSPKTPIQVHHVKKPTKKNIRRVVIGTCTSRHPLGHWDVVRSAHSSDHPGPTSPEEWMILTKFSSALDRWDRKTWKQQKLWDLMIWRMVTYVVIKPGQLRKKLVIDHVLTTDHGPWGSCQGLDTWLISMATFLIQLWGTLRLMAEAILWGEREKWGGNKYYTC